MEFANELKTAIPNKPTPSTMGSPRPTTSLASKRYDNSKIVEPSYSLLDPCLFLPAQEPKPLYLPPSWSSFTHPEGQLYFFCDATPRIVTEAYLFRPETAEKILNWAKWFEVEIIRRKMIMPNTVELFLQLDEESNSCEYYFVDHASRTEFWFEPLPTNLLDLPPAVSPSHLRLALEELYWHHIQYFPMHFGGLPSRALDELIGVFMHGQADQLTSDVSTFPYSAEKCSQFLTLLRNSREDISSGHTTCVIARLWGTISNSRFSSHYGQEYARLSRDQALLVAPISEYRWPFKAISRLLLGVPAVFVSRFKDLFVDELVYIDQWRPFVSECVDNWKLYTSWALPLLISSLLLSLSPLASPAVAVASFIACCSSILSAIALNMRHATLVDANAPEAAAYLLSVQSSTFGFQLVAAIYSLPQAFAGWGFGLFLVQGLIVASGTVGALVAALASVFMVALFTTIRLVISPAEGGFRRYMYFWPRTSSLERRSPDEKV